jgi:hypothetical protein
METITDFIDRQKICEDEDVNKLYIIALEFLVRCFIFEFWKLKFWTSTRGQGPLKTRRLWIIGREGGQKFNILLLLDILYAQPPVIPNPLFGIGMRIAYAASRIMF